MPWHVVPNHSSCPASKPYAVVKNADGHVEGCHATRADAEDQMAALYANEPDSSSVVRSRQSEEPRNVPTPVQEVLVTDVALGSTDSSVTDKPWDGSASRFSDDQYKMATAACDPDHGNTPKAQCFLPHHEPGGATNRNGVHAAAGRANQVKGYSAASVGRAKSHLRSHYSQLGEKPPPGIAASLVLTAKEIMAVAADIRAGCQDCDEHGHLNLARYSVGANDDCGDDFQYAVLDAQEPAGQSPVEACFDDQELAQAVADRLNSGALPDPDDEATQAIITALGGKPNKGTAKDRRLRRNAGETPKEPKTHTPNSKPTASAQLADNTPSDDDESGAPVMTMTPTWRGTLVVEGSPTGDGREFASDAVTWVDPPMPLRWQKEDSHGGMPTNVTVRVGSITKVWRDGADIMGEGVFDLDGPDDDDAHQAYRTMQQNGGMGVSIDADDITDADIEYVFPEGNESEDDDLFFLLFAAPEKIIFHSARIRAATLCDIPAFIEANLALVPDDEQPALTAGSLVDQAEWLTARGLAVIKPLTTEEMALVAGATVTPSAVVTAHHTPTVDAPWDGAAVERQLGALHVETAELLYAWIDLANVNGDARQAARLLHHDADGRANLSAVSSALSSLHAVLPETDRRAAYEHLATHLRDAGLEPPILPNALVAHAWHEEYRPPRGWFNDPQLGQVTPIMVTDAGRVYGHAAQWGQCHLGYLNECVMPPHEGYHSYFLTGEVICDDGGRVPVGQVTAGIDHADLSWRATKAKSHYENTEAVVADVVTGEDAHGIWVAGALRPTALSARTYALRASGQVSPDWRDIGGYLRMVALLTVNTSGFQTPRVRSFVADGRIRSLVASGMVSVRHAEPSEDDLNRRALELMRERLIAEVHGTH